MVSEFQGQQPKEKVIFVFRRHPIAMTKMIFVPAILLMIILVAICLDLVFEFHMEWIYWLLFAGFLFVVEQVFSAWIKWYYTIYIITNKRVRQQIQQTIFRKNVVDIYLDKVQNIRYNIDSFIGSVLGFGTIIIQTIAGNLVMTKIDKCEMVYDELLDIIDSLGSEDSDQEEKQ